MTSAPAYPPLRPVADHWPPLASLLNLLVRDRQLADFDRHFTELLDRLDQHASPELLLTAAFARFAVDQGHVCLDLPQLVDRWPMAVTQAGYPPPKLEQLLSRLRRWSLVGDEAHPPPPQGETPPLLTPLVLSGRRLYLRRYWQYEQSLAADIRRRAVSLHDPPEPSRAAARLAELTAAAGVELDGDQRRAVLAALNHHLTVISGGPGTGKTTIVLFILTLLRELAVGATGRGLRVLLLAPTGKAAARLAESLRGRLEGVTAMTIHRALGYQAETPTRFRHTRARPLAADLVVVDEASMVDMALMSKLFAAVPTRARLVMLGDQDQLASVEAGSILGDICLAASDLDSAVIELSRGFRFDPRYGIGALVRGVKTGDPAAVLASLRQRQADEPEGAKPVGVPPAGGPEVTLSENVEAAANRELQGLVLAGFRPCLTAASPAEALARLADFRLLCAHRRGRYGVEYLNDFCRQLLAADGLLATGEEQYYQGRPVLIVANNYQDHLFNGDLGIIWPSAADDDELMAFFPLAQGSPRRLPLGRLPRHETAFAMTIHKSQGSEFDQLAILLPGEDSPLLSRELLYTAVSRARHRVHLFGSEEVISRAIRRRVTRTSGLAAALARRPAPAS